jgi:ketosteroid isomerase-like protein
LNFDDPELKKILPWAGTGHGPGAFTGNVLEIFHRWENQNFEVAAIFDGGENVAVFGQFTYRSKTLGKTVTTPFSIHVKVIDGKITYLQFLEDSYGTAATFRVTGSWTVQTLADETPYTV